MAVRIRHADDEDVPVNHEINVTPFIDVMLVLLIIFMVAAPLATVDLQVELPTSTARPSPRPEQPIFLTIQADHGLLLSEQRIIRERLPAALLAQSAGDRERRIFLRADKSIDYGTLMSVMNDLRAAGYLKVALVGAEDPAGH